MFLEDFEFHFNGILTIVVVIQCLFFITIFFTSKDKLEPAGEIPDETCHILILSAPRCHPETREEGGVSGTPAAASPPRERRPAPMCGDALCADYSSPGYCSVSGGPPTLTLLVEKFIFPPLLLHFCRKSVT